MKNTSQKNGFLAGMQSSTLEDKPKKLSKSQLRNNIILCAVCFISFLFLLWIYFKWQTIPIRKHYFNTELIASQEDERTIKVQFRIEEPKTLDIDKEFEKKGSIAYNKSQNNNNSIIDKSDRNSSIVSCTYTDCGAHINAYPLQKFSTPMSPTINKKLLLEYIGQSLFNELSNKCKNDDIELGFFTELLFYRHLDNEKSIDRNNRLEHKFNYVRNKCGEFYAATEKNRFALSDFSREKKLGIYTIGFENEEINNYNLKHSKTGFKNITQSYILASYINRYTYNSSIETRITGSKLLRFLYYLFKLEDISQSYYSIKLYSKSFSELSLHMEFFGTIDCLYDSSGLNNVKVDKNRSAVEITTKNASDDCSFFGQIKFNDMQNMQNSRLFIISVLITLIFTELLRRIVRLINSIILQHKQPQKISDNNSARMNELTINETIQQDDDDLPQFYL